MLPCPTTTVAMHATIYLALHAQCRHRHRYQTQHTIGQQCPLLATCHLRHSRDTIAVKDFRSDHAAATNSSRSAIAESQAAFRAGPLHDPDISAMSRDTVALQRSSTFTRPPSLFRCHRDRRGLGVGDSYLVAGVQVVDELRCFRILHCNGTHDAVGPLERHRVE